MRLKIKNIDISPEDALYCITNKNTDEIKNRIAKIGYSTTFIREIDGRNVEQYLDNDSIYKLDVYVAIDDSPDLIKVYLDIDDCKALIRCGYYLGKITDKRKIEKVLNRWFKKGALAKC